MKAKGFTLIEVLVALMLLSMVMYIGSLSFSIFSERWRKELGSFNDDVNNTRNLLLLRQVLHGTANYLVRDNNNQPTYLYYGDESQLVFVTNAPLLETAYQAWVQLSIKTTEHGQQQLWYAEASFKSGALLSLAPPEFTGKKMRLLTNSNIRFNYFGWPTFAARIRYTEDRAGKPVWQPSYNAATVGVIPYAVNVTWAENEPMVFMLPHDNRVNFIKMYDEQIEP